MTEQQARNQGRSNRRLTGISHHFLSDASISSLPVGRAERKTVTIVDQHQGRFPTLALAATVARLGIDCHVHEHGQTAIRLRPVAGAGEKPQAHGGNRSLHIHICASADAVSDMGVDTLLFTLPASDKGIRDGFMRLKYFLNVMRPQRIGLTLMDCADMNQARHYYSVMKQACRDFLATRLYSYGALGNGPAPSGSELAGIARLLLTDHGLGEATPPQIIRLDKKSDGILI